MFVKHLGNVPPGPACFTSPSLEAELSRSLEKGKIQLRRVPEVATCLVAALEVWRCDRRWQENVKLKVCWNTRKLFIYCLFDGFIDALLKWKNKVKLVYWCSDGYNGSETVILCNVVHVCRVGPTAYRVPITPGVVRDCTGESIPAASECCAFAYIHWAISRGEMNDLQVIYIYTYTSMA